MQLVIKAVMHIFRCIVIGIRLIVTAGTVEQFPPLLHHALAASMGKPFPFRAASGAVL